MIFGGTVFASTGWQSVQIWYNNIKINLDGEEITPRDARGNVVDPFIMDGTTYLPVRAIGEALGLDVEWNGNTHTVFITTPEVPPPPRPRVTYLHEVAPAFETFNPISGNPRMRENQSFKMLGDEYVHGWRFTCSWASAGIGSPSYQLYNLRGQYTTIKGVLGHVDGTNRDSTGTLSIYLDNELYRQYPLTATMLPMEIILNVIGVNIMKIEFTLNDMNEGQFGFGNVTIFYFASFGLRIIITPKPVISGTDRLQARLCLYNIYIL
jgi:hypothetical protein